MRAHALILPGDRSRGRKTEVDFINGEVVRLAHALGRAPVNARLVALIHAAEQGGKRDFTGAELLHALLG